MKSHLFRILISCAVLLTGCSDTVESVESESPVLLTAPESTEAPQTTAVTTTEELTATTPPPEETIASESPPEDLPFSLYDALYYEISNFHTVMTFYQKLSTEEVAQAVSELERQHPEIFWLKGYSMKYNDKSAEITLKVINDYPPDTLRQMSEELSAKADAVLNEIDTSGSEYDKALAVHDYLVTHTVYDQANVNNGKGLWNTAYGCLINGLAVCQGYAQSYQILMNRLGIECGTCSGDALGEAHAWNYLKLNQQYYWVDVTWDDPVTGSDDTADWIHHDYFLIDDAMLNRTRTFSDNGQFIPECSSTAENYFLRNGNYLTEYQFTEIDNRLTAHSDEGRIEIMFADEASYQTAINDLFNNEMIWKAQIFQSTGGQINYHADEHMYTIRLMFHINN